MLLAIAFVSGGATCAKRRSLREGFVPPVVFQEDPSLQQIVEHVNRSLTVTQLASNTLSVTSPDSAGKLSGSFKWERPHNFTLEAYVGPKIVGIALAAGSNSDMFWLQTPNPPTVHFARHDEFENQSGARYVLPVSPLWLREALGVVEFDPEGQHEEPTIRADGRIEVVSYIPSPRGAYRRVLVMTPSFGTIEQTRLYDHSGKLVAVAQLSDHQYYSAIDWSLPHNVIVQLHPDEGPPMAFTIDIGFYLINQPASDDPAAFQPPDPTGLSTVNLVRNNNAQGPARPSPPAYTPTEPLHEQGSLGHYRIVR